MTPSGYAFLLLTGFVAVLIAILAFALLKFGAAVRDAKRNARERSSDRVFVASAVQDAVTRLKAQEQAMSARAEASEQLSGQIVASLTAGLLVVDRDGNVQILNPAGRKLLGVQDEVMTAGYQELLADAAPVAEVIGQCIATGEPIVRRALRIDRAGRPMHLGVTVSPLEGGASQGAICLFSDLTAVIEMEEQLRLKVTLARLGELTAGLAHEFRNGLATIHGYGRLIDPGAVPPPYGPYVEGIRQETDALQKVVTNFLNFARPEQLTFQPVDLEDLVRRSAEDVLPADGTRGALRVGGDFPTVTGDEVMLRQVFSNLVRNAIEACEGAGVAPQVAVVGSIDRGAGLAGVAVEDNGPGIDAALAERVFTPFFTTKPQGTGLGLSVVQKIVVTHNGRVLVGRSAAGGARIQVILPLDPRNAGNVG